MSWLGVGPTLDSKTVAPKQALVSAIPGKYKMVRHPGSTNKGCKLVLLKGSMRKGGRRQGGSRNLQLPREIPVFSVINTKLRFKNSGAIATATTGLITINDIFGAILCIGKVSNTSVTPLATSFRIRKVSIWISGSTAAEADAGIAWFSANSDQDPDMEYVDEIQQMAGLSQCVVSRPPKNSTAGFWYRDTVSPVNTAVFGLKISNQNSITEVDLDWTLPTSVVGSATITVSTATVGAMYRLALNKTNGSSTLVPYNYTTTT